MQWRNFSFRKEKANILTGQIDVKQKRGSLRSQISSPLHFISIQ